MRTTALPLSVLILSCGMSAVGCSGSGAAVGLPTTSPSTGGVTSAGGHVGSGGVVNPGGASAGGNDSANGGSSVTIDTQTTGGESSVGGAPTTGGKASTGGSVATGGKATSGGAATGGVATGGAATGGVGTKATGGAATGGAGTKATGGAATGGVGTKATGGAATGGGTATGGAPSTSTSTSDVDCSAPMPTGGVDHTGASVNGTADGLNYGIWTNGSGGTITVFSNAHAFATSWNNSQDFLAHLGLDWYTAKPYTSYGTITAQFSEKKSGTDGGWSSIGIYGWMHSPCIEWYINEDSFEGMYGNGSITATIDGATYYLSTTTTNGTGGANACESGHTGMWTQIHSIRKTARQCGTVTVSDHFAAWEKQGWSLGTLSMVHINIEVGGGTGSIQFPVANVTTTAN